MKSHASMNRIYRLVWNASLGLWVAVAENAKGRGKGGRAASALLAVLAVLSSGLASNAYAANAADAALRGALAQWLRLAAPPLSTRPASAWPLTGRNFQRPPTKL